MDGFNERLIQAITQNDLKSIRYCLKKGASVNKICSCGMTPLGVAAHNGNLVILKSLTEAHKNQTDNFEDLENDNYNRKMLTLDVDKCKNIGYFIVCKDLDEEFGEGPTPEAMEGLEWDMEIADELMEEDLPTPPDASIYKWYAKILNRTSLVLKSPENDIARLDSHGRNILHYAVKNGNLEMVHYLLDTHKEFCVDQGDTNWFSPLHLATACGDIEMVKLLLKKGANVNFLNRERQTPLHLAAQLGEVHIINILVDHKANLNTQDIEERSPLTLAILYRQEESAKLLIQRGTRLNYEEAGGYTVLHRAVWSNLSNVTKMLLEFGAKVIQSHFLLHMAIRNNNLDIVRMLHKGGAVVNVRDHEGNTPLMISCAVQNLSIARYLLKNGAPANAANQINGMTALHVCVKDIRDSRMFQQFLELLVFYNANVNANSFQGNILFYAIILGNLRAASVLIKYGADVNLREERALIDNLTLAKKHGNLELVKLVIYAGFNFSNMLFDLKSLKNQGDDPVYEFLEFASHNPLNLRDICRIKIRKCLGRNLVFKMNKLPLPTMLLQFLTLEIL